MSGAPILDARELRKRFGGLVAVDGVTLSVAPGETLAIVGPNGSGKTTTLELLAGTLTPDTGRIRLGDREVTRLPAHRRAALGLARTFQNGRVFGNLTVDENVRVGLRAAGRGAGAPLDEDAAVGVQLARFGDRLSGRRDRRTYGLSYANRRRVEVARALAQAPAVLLLDEPTAGMNPVETAEFTRLLVELRAQGQAMVIVEHKLDVVRAVAHRVVVLDAGRPIFAGLPADLQGDRAVVEAYLGRAVNSTFVRTPRAVPADAPPLLALEGIAAQYGAFRALDDVSLCVGPGEIVSLLGGNASGKSTTLKIVLGLLAPRAGRVVFDGVDVTALGPAARIARGLAAVPEGRRVFGAMSVEDNLRLGAFVRRDRIDDDLTRVFTLFPRLAERRRAAAGTLSGGEAQMLAFGRAMMSRPRLICMDEPTMGLAPTLVERVLRTIQELHAAGTSVLFVEQNASAALQIAHRAYVLRQGAIVRDGAADELAAEPAIIDAYVG